MRARTVVWMVARREYTERMRDRTFLIVNGVVFAIVLLGGIGGAVFGAQAGGPTAVAAVEGQPAEILATAEGIGEQTGLDLTTSTVADEAAGERLLRDGEAEAVVADGRILVLEEVDPLLQATLDAAARSVVVEAVLAEAGVDDDQRALVVDGAALSVERLEESGGSVEFTPAFGVGLVAVPLLYGLLVLYGTWVAQGIVEEKSSRVVEVLLATIRPSQLLTGKVLGIGALGLTQLLGLVVIGGGVFAVTMGDALPAGSAAVLAVVLAWYVLGYALYALLFAVAGATVSRVEDLQSTSMPAYVLVIGAFFVAQASAFQPQGLLSRVAAYVPFTAPLVQPLRTAAGAGSPMEVALGAAATAAFAALLIPLAARLYTGGLLRTGGRVKVSDAWRGGG